MNRDRLFLSAPASRAWCRGIVVASRPFCSAGSVSHPRPASSPIGGRGYRPQPVYSRSPPVVVEQPVYVNRAPPPPRYEPVPPPPRNVASAWDPGRWRWNGHDYVWEQGHYMRAPHRDARWVAGHWVHHERQWVWQPGHWA